MFGDLFGGGSVAAPEMDPEVKRANLEMMGLGKERSAQALSRGDEVYGQNRSRMDRAATITGDMQGLAADDARAGAALYKEKGAPLLDTIYGRNVFTPDQRQSKVNEAVGAAAAQSARALDKQTQLAMRRAAAAGVRFGLDPKDTVAAVTASVGAQNQARDATVADLDARERQMYDLVAGREAAGRQSQLSAANLGGALTGQVGQQQQVALGGIDASTRALAPAMQSLGNMTNFDTQAQMAAFNAPGDQGFFGEIAPIVGMGAQLYGAGAFGAPWWASKVAGGKAVGADGGEIGQDVAGYADGGRFEAILGSGIYAYADGGEVEFEDDDDLQPALQRADGALTRGDGSGGTLQGPGTGISDDIPAVTDTGEEIRVANGEYIIPKDVVDILGEDFFDSLIQRLHTPAALQREQGVA